MGQHINWMIAAALVSLSACSTTSFAPPVVEGPGSQKTLSEGLNLLDRYTTEYRNAAAGIANGRQLFDVPAMVALVGGTTAAALGANADVAIGTGAVSALASSARQYYAPDDRADIYYDAVEAFSCIRRETLGISIKTTDAKMQLSGARIFIDGAKRRDGAVAADIANAQTFIYTLNELIIDRETQAYGMLYDAILSVENKARQRLSTKGSIADATTIAALVMQYQKQIEDAKKPPPADGAAMDFLSDASAIGTSMSAWANTINLEELQPKLAQCVLLSVD